MFTTGETWIFLAQIILMCVLFAEIARGPRKKAGSRQSTVDGSEKK